MWLSNNCQIVVKRHTFYYFLPHLSALKSVDFTHFLRIYQLLLLPQRKRQLLL
nr:MAG TPA: hypothetical protein [Caudoviricetes sp.]